MQHGPFNTAVAYDPRERDQRTGEPEADSASQLLAATLDHLGGAESWLDQIEDSLFGPHPRAAGEGAPKTQPHLIQSAQIIAQRVNDISQRLARVTRAL